MNFEISKSILNRAGKLYQHSNKVLVDDTKVVFTGKNCKLLCCFYARECYLDDNSWVDTKPVVYRIGNGYGFDFSI